MLESDEVDKVIHDIDLVDTLFKENPEYIDYLSNPSVPKSERIESLRSVFEGQV
jgi:F0F1-type ATP synthase delta subunit